MAAAPSRTSVDCPVPVLSLGMDNDPPLAGYSIRALRSYLKRLLLKSQLYSAQPADYRKILATVQEGPSPGPRKIGF